MRFKPEYFIYPFTISCSHFSIFIIPYNYNSAKQCVTFSTFAGDNVHFPAAIVFKWKRGMSEKPLKLIKYAL